MYAANCKVYFEVILKMIQSRVSRTLQMADI